MPPLKLPKPRSKYDIRWNSIPLSGRHTPSLFLMSVLARQFVLTQLWQKLYKIVNVHFVSSRLRFVRFSRLVYGYTSVIAFALQTCWLFFEILLCCCWVQ
jgi:hypothetical protein